MKDTMKAAIYRGIGTLNIEDVPVPRITDPKDVLIKISCCSICGTDVHMMRVPPTYEAKPDTILGHELVGTIIEVGSDVLSLKVGDRVVVNPNENCGVCDNCRRGKINHCENNKSMGIDVDGGFAEYVKATEKQVYNIGDLPDHVAVFAEPLACAMNGYSKINIPLLSKVVVIGCGPIGLQFAMLARKDGADVVCIEPNEKRRALSEKLGFPTCNPFEENSVTFVIDHFGGLADFVIDAAGSQLPAAMDIADCNGTILIFGVNNKIEPSINATKIQNKELTIIGSFIAYNSFPMAIDVLKKNILDLEPLITHVLPLEDVHKGINLMSIGEGMEVIIDF